MERKECEKKLDAICDRIGESFYQIQDFTAEKTELDKKFADLERLENINQTELEQLHALVKKQLLYDEAYANYHEQLTNLQYGIFRESEWRIQTERKEIQEIEERQSVMKGDLLQMEQGIIASQEEEETKEDKQKLFFASLLSIFAMIGISFFLIFYFYRRYQFPYQVPVGIVTAGGILVLFLLIFCKMKGIQKHNQVSIRNENYTALMQQERLRYEINQQKLENLYGKYQVENEQQFLQLWAYYHEEQAKQEKKNVRLLIEIKQQILELLEKYEFVQPEFWVNFPYGFLEQSEQEQIKNYLQNRKNIIQKVIEKQQAEQKKEFDEIRVILEEYPELNDYVLSALEHYNMADC